MTDRISGHVVVIAGASSGIGEALARALTARGAKIALVARRVERLRTLAAACGPHALPIVADLTHRGDARRVVAETLDRFDHIDVWVNNVGRGITRMPLALTDEDVDEMMRVNVKTALYGMQEVMPHFKARGEGHIINISSMLGRMPAAVIRSAYSGAKHFLNALTANVRTEIQATHPGIQVSLVSPGVVATEFGLSAVHGGVDSRTLPGAQTADEVAQVIVDTIDSRKPDVYTRPDGAEIIQRYIREL